jgi:hypothetical protein
LTRWVNAHSHPETAMATRSVQALVDDIRLLSEDQHALVQSVRELARKMPKRLISIGRRAIPLLNCLQSFNMQPAKWD